MIASWVATVFRKRWRFLSYRDGNIQLSQAVWASFLVWSVWYKSKWISESEFVEISEPSWYVSKMLGIIFLNLNYRKLLPLMPAMIDDKRERMCNTERENDVGATRLLGKRKASSVLSLRTSRSPTLIDHRKRAANERERETIRTVSTNRVRENSKRRRLLCCVARSSSWESASRVSICRCECRFHDRAHCWLAFV